jgi:hypothetical protein
VKKITTALFLCFLCAAAFGAENISAQADKNRAFVGDVINVRISAELPEGAYISAGQSVLFKDFDILSFDIEHVSFNPNKYVLTYKIAAYKTGNLTVEPVGISYENSDGKEKAFFTPALSVEIVSSLNGGGNDISDIKPLSKLRISRKNVVIICLLSVLTLVLLAYIMLNLPKKKDLPPYEETDPRKSALDKLEKLFKSGLKEKDIKLFYYAMSGILRGYVSKKYGFDAMEMTTSEFFEAMKTRLPEAVNVNEFKSYLRIFTLARYAGFKPAKNEIENSFTRTKNLLESL